MSKSPAVAWLSIFIAVLSAIAAGAGLLWPREGSPITVQTPRGDMVTLSGQGLYHFDSLFFAATYTAQDTVMLALGIPLLLIFLLLYLRGSLKGGLLLMGMLGFFLYVYASMSLGASYNPLFLVYVALFSASFFALIAILSSLDLRALPEAVLERLPRRGPAIYLFAAGALTLLVWLSPLVGAMLAHETPSLLGHYTTKVTDALDLAIITPSTFIAGVLILRRNWLGYRIAFPLLGIITMLLPVMTLSTIYQLQSGITFTPGEIIGPISGFSVLGLLAIWVMAAILRGLPAATETAYS
ncbi:MAG: hypothetical protein ACYC6A_10655 [Armatimonadota bacterium]